MHLCVFRLDPFGCLPGGRVVRAPLWGCFLTCSPFMGWIRWRNFHLRGLRPCGKSIHLRPMRPCGQNRLRPVRPWGNFHLRPLRPCGKSIHLRPMRPCGQNRLRPVRPCGNFHLRPLRPRGKSIHLPRDKAIWAVLWGFFLTCLGARALWAAGFRKDVPGLFGHLCRASF